MRSRHEICRYHRRIRPLPQRPRVAAGCRQKLLGAERVAVAMSCSLVQRGALPLLPEAVRHPVPPLTCGADLVFALPAPCACAGAEAFARAGVALLCRRRVRWAGLRGRDPRRCPSDGSRRASGQRRLPRRPESPACRRRAELRRRAAGRSGSACISTERVAALLDKPNNNLAVEYCRAIRSLAPQMEAAIPCPGRARTMARPSTLPTGILRQRQRTSAASGPRAERRPSRPYVPEAVFPLYQEAHAAGQYTDFSAAGRCELALLRSACRGETPFVQTCAASPRGWSTAWKPPSGPAPPTTTCWTPSLPSATPGRGCAASPWTPRWATPPTASLPFRPISICWEGRKDAHFLV